MFSERIHHLSDGESFREFACKFREIWLTGNR